MFLASDPFLFVEAQSLFRFGPFSGKLRFVLSPQARDAKALFGVTLIASEAFCRFALVGCDSFFLAANGVGSAAVAIAIVCF